MSDFALTKKSNGLYDLDMSNNDLVLTNSLSNAVVLSLGTWARDERLNDSATIEPQIGGWFGNVLGDAFGSRIWKSFRDTLNSASVSRATAFAKDALKWLVDDGVAKSVDVNVTGFEGTKVYFNVVVNKPDASGEEFRWQANWEAV